MGRRAGREVIGCRPVGILAVFQQGQLGGPAEGSLAGTQSRGQMERAASPVEVMQSVARLGSQTDAVHVSR